MHFRGLLFGLRFILPLAIVLGLSAYAVVPLVDDLTLRWFVKDLDIRSRLVANTLQEPLQDALAERSRRKVVTLLDRAARDERLLALAFCAPDGSVQYKTPSWPAAVGCRDQAAEDVTLPQMVKLPQGPVHVNRNRIERDGEHMGDLILVHDMSFIERRSADTRKYVVVLFAILGVLISMITVFTAWLSWRGWINAMKGLLRGELLTSPSRGTASPAAVQPLLSDLRALVNELNLERRQLAGSGQAWTPERLRELLRDELAGDEILVLSNREPYIHQRTSDGIEVSRPASGLVTAVEPVMRACSGTWIAHGAGSADRETVDKHDRVSVPPGNPSYQLRRVWLTKAEEQGYYYGFANEGLWPLCHIAHVRPVFRVTDWNEYVAVNQRFADTVVEEAHTDNPVVMVQDYHFALVPAMVRERLPKATIITFWHIPWPNPESFGICPWREEILKGLLGSTILGFHTAFHCKNFMETVERYLEARIEQEASTISFGGKLTQVEAYPISIAWPEADMSPSIEHCRLEIRRLNALPAAHRLAVGIDRLDYTKGILERFQAVERMLELHPSMIGQFSLIQVAAPSRSSLDEYQNFEARVRALAQRINSRFSEGGPAPIILRIAHHEHDEVHRYYRAADVCMVTSLHDGMNLVAKEYVAARDDERGVLILSQFTGAAREMAEALIVNPYHIEQGAETLYRALTMPEAEQRERMRSMRSLIKDFNIYRWAGRMLNDAARLRRRERIQAKIDQHSEPAMLKRVV
ncbi:trehalose-6-phosphate synthase [Lacisediminimonas sp.]|uniref:alpha,alpha-trehalose-phosphate synthase (UDP-forming) n=1 Tax=Lacisediminimonas sp. TaxID=3060582 RepID=UPI00271C2294|nr:trehalose-6-phosphate synthase [Lacisediminimonas sp.]MDO8298177.1 trehalose-6-phosphate synthase [Lacisediminimonas sp.]